jgi:hypothetical protein
MPESEIMSTPLDPSKFIDLNFVIRKIAWSIYEVNHPKAKGTLRLLGVPTNILEIPEEFLPPDAKPPVLAMNTQGIVGFINEGKKGPIGTPMSPQEFNLAPREDITSFVTTRDEPFNEYVAARRGKTPILIRTKTIMLKVQMLKDQTNVFGDPIIWVDHNTSHSATESKDAEMYLP